jgi:Asp-tRNA(Asn)/Glu-tRNA(Gln) amidotransferase A subunit family amidase
VAYVAVAELQRVLGKLSPTAAEQAAMQRVLDEAALKIDLYLGYTVDNPAPPVDAPAYQTLAEVNLGMAQELWSMEGRVAGIIPVGPDSVPVIAAHNIWNRWRLRLVPLKMNGWGLA